MSEQKVWKHETMQRIPGWDPRGAFCWQSRKMQREEFSEFWLCPLGQGRAGGSSLQSPKCRRGSLSLFYTRGNSSSLSGVTKNHGERDSKPPPTVPQSFGPNSTAEIVPLAFTKAISTAAFKALSILVIHPHTQGGSPLEVPCTPLQALLVFANPDTCSTIRAGAVSQKQLQAGNSVFLQPRQVLCGMQNIAPIWQQLAQLCSGGEPPALLHGTQHSRTHVSSPGSCPGEHHHCLITNPALSLLSWVLAGPESWAGSPGNDPRSCRCLQSFTQLTLPNNFYMAREKPQSCLHVSKDNLIVPGSI